MIKKEDVIKYLKEHSHELEDDFIIKEKDKWTTRTFQIRSEVLERFLAGLGKTIKTRDAVTEALELYIAKHFK